MSIEERKAYQRRQQPMTRPRVVRSEREIRNRRVTLGVLLLLPLVLVPMLALLSAGMN